MTIVIGNPTLEVEDDDGCALCEDEATILMMDINGEDGDVDFDQLATNIRRLDTEAVRRQLRAIIEERRRCRPNAACGPCSLEFQKHRPACPVGLSD
eukprot:1440243-Pyramimonas_sp.AAC.1